MKPVYYEHGKIFLEALKILLSASLLKCWASLLWAEIGKILVSILFQILVT